MYILLEKFLRIEWQDMTSAHLQGLAWIQSILDWTVSTFTSEATKGYKRYQQLTVAQLTTGLASSASKPVCFTKFTILATLQGLPHVANTDSVALDSCMLASLNAWPCVHWCPWMSIDVMQVMSCSAEMGPRSVDSRWWTSPKQCWRADGKLEFYTMHLPRDAKSTQPCIRLRVMRRADGRNTGFAHSNRYQLCLHPKGTCHRRQKRRFLFSKLHLEPKRCCSRVAFPVGSWKLQVGNYWCSLKSAQLGTCQCWSKRSSCRAATFLRVNG